MQCGPTAAFASRFRHVLFTADLYTGVNSRGKWGMYTQQCNYLSFLLRLWRTNIDQQTVWRVSLQDSLSEEQLIFSGLDELFAFLRQLAVVAVNEARDENGVE